MIDSEGVLPRLNRSKRKKLFSFLTDFVSASYLWTKYLCSKSHIALSESLGVPLGSRVCAEISVLK